MSAVAVLGEALVDLVGDGDRTFVARPGGSPANIAVAVARLGHAVEFLGALSTDRWGPMLDDHLTGAGVDTSRTPRSDRPTPLAVADVGPDGSAVYRFLWDDTADRATTLGDLPDDLGAEVSWLQVGSVAAALVDSGATVADLVARERDVRLVSCDPNVRTMVHGDGAEPRRRLRELADRADVVKISDEDLAFVLPDLEVDAAIARWLDLGVGLVAITRGGAGATLAGRGGRVDVAPPTTSVADTVGAGDTFMAGILAGLLDAGVTDRAALASLDDTALVTVGDLAARAAAVTVSRPGADPPTRGELS